MQGQSTTNESNETNGTNPPQQETTNEEENQSPTSSEEELELLWEAHVNEHVDDDEKEFFFLNMLGHIEYINGHIIGDEREDGTLFVCADLPRDADVIVYEKLGFTFTMRGPRS